MDGKRSGRGRLGRSRGFALEAPVLEGTWEADALVDGAVELAGGEPFRGALHEAPKRSNQILSTTTRGFPRFRSWELCGFLYEVHFENDAVRD